MRQNKSRHAVLVLGQPGAVAFFNPVLPALREHGWGVTVLDGNATSFDVEASGHMVVVTSATYAPAERAALAWAKRHGIPSAQLVDSWYDYRRRIEATNGPGLMPNEILVLDETAKNDAAAEGLPAQCIRVVGHPAWEAIAPLPDAPISNVLLVDQPVSDDMGRRLGYDEDDFLALVRSGLGSDYRLTLALHPRRKQAAGDPAIPGAIVSDVREAVKTCGTVIGMFSSFLVEAYLSGRRVVSVQPNAGVVDYCILSRLKLIPRVTAAAQLSGAIAAARPGLLGFNERFAHSRARVVEAFAALAA